MAVPDGLRVDIHLDPCDAAEQLREEQALFAALRAEAPRLRIWQPKAALIATVAESQMPGFGAAVDRARDRGLAVHVRRTGGGAVCLGPGTLAVSHLYGSPRHDLDASYGEFADRLRAAAAELGIALSAHEVGSAYCNGRFDLAWRGLKVGGIAQRRRVQAGVSLIWIHAVLAVESRALRYPEAVAAFQSDLGLPRIADARSTTCLSECLPVEVSAGSSAPGAPGVPVQDLSTRCAAAIVRAFVETAAVTP